jgi:PAS domain S-box-containing protein
MLLQAPVAMCILLGPDHIITLANQLIVELWGKPATEVINKPIFEALPEARSQGLEEIMANVYYKGESFRAYEMPVTLMRNGVSEVVYQNFVYEPYKDTEGAILGIIAITIDVTAQVEARKEMEAINEKMSAANEQLRLAIATANLGTWSVHLSTDKLTISSRARIMHGLAPKEPLRLAEAMNLVVPEHRDLVSKSIEHAIQKRGGFEIEYQVQPKDGSSPKWLRSTGKAYVDNDGEPIHITGTIMDITDRKQEEQRKDDFISIASHELKTPVTTLKASLQLLDRMKSNPSPTILPTLIEQSNKSVEKITTLINELLYSSRLSEGQLQLSKTTFTISELLNGCCNHVRVAGKHQLIFKGDNKLQVTADEHRVDQVVVNMVNNAVKYAPNSKEIYLMAEKVGNMAKISVKDNGPGITPDKIPHLFSRYYRADYTGIQYSGLGLGLYISSEIVKRHGGDIGVDSELGKGSTFWFTLPLNG